jgi:hypothetical protein
MIVAVCIETDPLVIWSDTRAPALKPQGDERPAAWTRHPRVWYDSVGYPVHIG